MLNCQHVKPIVKGEPVTKFYTRLTAQPVRIYFDFAPKYKHRSSIGNVTVSIQVSEVWYGPYLTSIATTTNVYNDRKSLYPSNTAKEVDAKIKGLNDLLLEAWNSLLPLKLPITGEMILQKADLIEKEVPNV